MNWIVNRARAFFSDVLGRGVSAKESLILMIGAGALLLATLAIFLSLTRSHGVEVYYSDEVVTIRKPEGKELRFEIGPKAEILGAVERFQIYPELPDSFGELHAGVRIRSEEKTCRTLPSGAQRCKRKRPKHYHLIVVDDDLKQQVRGRNIERGQQLFLQGRSILREVGRRGGGRNYRINTRILLQALK